ncbi:MAG: LuxR family transcriptional regulator [Phycisphaera sp.]|nr:MAG: LuxR family transcriptional regulator [Phycisphaera sp.]
MIPDGAAYARVLNAISVISPPPMDDRVALATARRAAMDAIADVLESELWFRLTSKDRDPDPEPMVIDFMQRGMTDEEISLAMQCTQDPDNPPPYDTELTRRIRLGLDFAARRSDLVDDVTWYTSGHWEKWRSHMRMDDFIVNTFPSDGGIFTTCAFHRRPDRERFTPEESAFAFDVVRRIPWLYLSTVAIDVGVPLDGMTPRQRSVFGLMLEGWRKRQIAEHLGISEDTANKYMKAVYKSFGVSGQVELIARVLKSNVHT